MKTSQYLYSYMLDHFHNQHNGISYTKAFAGEYNTKYLSYVCRSNTERRSLSGTSMACPTVAGVVATLLQRFPSYTPRQIRDQLFRESTSHAVNMRTFQGNNLPSIIASTTPNRFAYTGRCGGSKTMLHNLVIMIIS